MRKLLDALKPGPVGIDTAIFIYFIEEHPRYFCEVEALFQALEKGFVQGVTSGITLLETLIHPLRNRNQQLAQEYESILTQSRNLHLIELTIPLLRTAAQLRADTGMKTPDALQIAAALSMTCPVFVTNDRQLPQIESLRILQLEELA
ncbi:MAG: PIN domain-containing protein [Desulfovermiculus sp.]